MPSNNQNQNLPPLPDSIPIKGQSPSFPNPYQANATYLSDTPITQPTSQPAQQTVLQPIPPQNNTMDNTFEETKKTGNAGKLFTLFLIVLVVGGIIGLCVFYFGSNAQKVNRNSLREDTATQVKVKLTNCFNDLQEYPFFITKDNYLNVCNNSISVQEDIGKLTIIDSLPCPAANIDNWFIYYNRVDYKTYKLSVCLESGEKAIN